MFCSLKEFVYAVKDSYAKGAIMAVATLKQIEAEFGKDFKSDDFAIQRFGHWKFLIHIPSGCPVGVKRCVGCPGAVQKSCRWINQ